jgi:hypothetical protein
MRNTYLRTLIPLVLVCSGTDAIPLSGNDGSLTPVVTPRDTPSGRCPGQDGPGIMITNKATKDQSFIFFKNQKDGNGWADPEWHTPDPNVPSVTVGPGKTQYVKIDLDWKGRVQRGDKGGNPQPGTWGEFQLHDTDTTNGHVPDYAAHGDISLIQGCDGAAMVSATDSSSAQNGFTKDCIAGAPPAALVTRPDGSKAVGRLVQMWEGADKTAGADPWLKTFVQPTQAYMLNSAGQAASDGVPDVSSKNNCLQFDFY